MTSPIIRIENLGKRYRIRHQKGSFGGYRRLSEDLVHIAKAPLKLFRRNDNSASVVTPSTADDSHSSFPETTQASVLQPSSEDFWALKDVSFEVQPGEVVGIIGRNGAGKSTLLKLLSRITEPTTGRIELNGRVASLLEVGTGFHPELTGRENIFLNGAILGMTRVEIKRNFDEIVAFAEVERFLDTPVKRYSSGMYVRLAFAVAAHLDCELVLVDEVLAVGDAEFQKKCLGKMQDVAKSGRTVLFVSHNILSVKTLCSRGLYLKNGQLLVDHDIETVTHKYLVCDRHSSRQIEFDIADTSAGDHSIRVKSARITDQNLRSCDVVNVDTPFFVEVIYEILKAGTDPRINLHFMTEDSEYAFASFDNSELQRGKCGTFVARMKVPADFLNGKGYTISIYATSVRPTRVHAVIRDCLSFDVVDSSNSSTRLGYDGAFPGAIRPMMEWKTREVT